jgi:hypothetical protein
MFKLAYCDFIADRIRKGLLNSAGDSLEPVRIEVGKIQFDLDEDGAFRSTAKSITVYDHQGKAYIVSIQEAPMLDKEI